MLSPLACGTTAVTLLAALALPGPPAAGRESGDPPLSVPQATLDAALDCDDFVHGTEPVLLVHGIGVSGPEEWDWGMRPLLRAAGFDTCVVTLPDRGLPDAQTSAEYVVNAVHRVHARSGGRKVGIVGHSLGGVLPRWAIKYWPSVRQQTADFVALSGANHGFQVDGAPLRDSLLRPPLPPIVWQGFRDSRLFAALNRDDEAPPPVDYTAIFSRSDVLFPPPTAAIAYGDTRGHVRNILIEDVCPRGQFERALIDHFAVITDPAVLALTVDALSHAGPADVARSSATNECETSQEALVTSVTQASGLLPVLTGSTLPAGPPGVSLVTSEPPLRPYAR